MDLLRLFGWKHQSYSGSSSYLYVEDLLRRQKNLLIVSPFIDGYYARYLLSHSHGKNIRIISSSMQDDAAKLLRNTDLRPALGFASAVFVANVAFFLLGWQFIAFAALSSIAAAAFIALSFKKHSGITVKVPKSFVHAKMYIGDDLAIEGSANLTYAGMHKNVEHVEVITDRARVAELRRQFIELWNSE
ncbi:PLD-like domain protein [uncultured archaeon]|nr:PLD-like domain protein [uncultured archaeon]